MKTEDHRKKLIEQLQRTPIVQIACEKTGVSRATYYRWRKASKKFKQEADKAILQGTLLVNDLAESQLISAIRSQHMTAIIFWLKHHHKDYKTKVELSGEVKTTGEKLTPNQEQAILQALALSPINNNLINLQNGPDKENNKGDRKRSKGKKRSDKK